jgi:hypothetical protein
MKNILILSTFILLFVSCEKSLDLEPYLELKSEEVLKNAESIDVAVNGIYLQAGWAFYAGTYKYYGDYMGDLIQPRAGYKPNNNYFRNADRGTWEAGYQVITAANLVIEACNKGNAGNDANAHRMKGEALFWRGTTLFELTRQFGPQYDGFTPTP